LTFGMSDLDRDRLVVEYGGSDLSPASDSDKDSLSVDEETTPPPLWTEMS